MANQEPGNIFERLGCEKLYNYLFRTSKKVIGVDQMMQILNVFGVEREDLFVFENEGGLVNQLFEEARKQVLRNADEKKCFFKKEHDSAKCSFVVAVLRYERQALARSRLVVLGAFYMALPGDKAFLRMYEFPWRKPYRCDSEKEQAKLVSDHLEDTLLGSRKELLYKFRDGVTLVDLEKELKTPYILELDEHLEPVASHFQKFEEKKSSDPELPNFDLGADDILDLEGEDDMALEIPENIPGCTAANPIVID